MARFICAVSETDGAPAAVALVEQQPGPSGPVYTPRVLHRLGDDPVTAVRDLLAGEPQYVGQTEVVAAGGQPGADRFGDTGLSAIAVSVTQGGRGADATTAVSQQVLVDTFEKLYRSGAVEMPNATDLMEQALHAMYDAADLDAAADDGPETYEDEALGEDPGPTASTVEQSGSAESAGTATVPGDMIAVPDAARAGRIASATGDAVDLGDSADVALALALACWYGEYSVSELAATDQADEV